MNRHKPHMVQFSGHGTPDGLLMMGPRDRSAPLAAGRLINMLKWAGEDLRIVFFNICDSEEHARAAARIVDAAIGMRGQMHDAPARVFAAHLYSGLAFGNSLKRGVSSGMRRDRRRARQRHAAALLPQWQGSAQSRSGASGHEEKGRHGVLRTAEPRIQRARRRRAKSVSRGPRRNARRLGKVEEQVAEFHRRSAHRESIIDRLHEENQRLRGGSGPDASWNR